MTLILVTDLRLSECPTFISLCLHLFSYDIYQNEVVIHILIIPFLQNNVKSSMFGWTNVLFVFLCLLVPCCWNHVCSCSKVSQSKAGECGSRVFCFCFLLSISNFYCLCFTACSSSDSEHHQRCTGYHICCAVFNGPVSGKQFRLF